MREWINANETIQEDDHGTVMAAIRLACEDGCRKVVIPRYNARTKGTVWSFLHAIELPSDFTLLLDNCFLEQGKGSYENLIMNERAHDMAYSNVWENETRNISVIGEGNVTLSGGCHNLNLEKTAGSYGLPSMYFQPILFWHNVNGLRVENIHFEHQRWWAILHIMTCNVVLRNLDFYAIPHVPNLDGIDLRIGCHHFDIENITGRTGDDVLALTAVAGKSDGYFAVGGKDINIRNIKARNIKADSHFCYIVRLLNHSGAQEFNIDMDVVMDSSDPSTYVQSGAAVAVGSPYYVGRYPAAHGDTHDICFSNIYSRGRAALALSHTLKNVRFTNVHTFSDCTGLVNAFVEGGHYENVLIDHAYYEYEYTNEDVPMDRAYFEHEYKNKSVPAEGIVGTLIDIPVLNGDMTLKHVESGAVRRVVSVQDGDGVLTIEDLSVKKTAEEDICGGKRVAEWKIG